jgi:hypothetical protein
MPNKTESSGPAPGRIELCVQRSYKPGMSGPTIIEVVREKEGSGRHEEAEKDEAGDISSQGR